MTISSLNIFLGHDISMGNILWHINQWIDFLCRPFSGGPPLLYLYGTSLITAFILLILFKRISNQAKIAHHQGKIIGYLLEIAIYRDQLGRILSNQFAILYHLLNYLRYTLIPVLILSIPIVIIVIQIDNRMGRHPLRDNDRFIFRVTLEKHARHHMRPTPEQVVLKTAAGLVVETPILRIDSEGSMFWRVRLNSLNNTAIEVRLTDGSESLQKKIISRTEPGGFSRSRVKADSFQFLTNSAETPIPPSSVFRSVSVGYRTALYSILFWETTAVVYFFLLTVFFGLILKPVLNVKI